jgi:tetratricopeptide (TPR) repeat protein
VIRFLWQTEGAAAFRDVYARGTLDIAALAPAYFAFLDTVPSSQRAVALAQQRYAAPGIVRRPCPHEVAELQRMARSAPSPAVAEELWSRCVQLEPDDPEHLVQLRRAQLRAGDVRGAEETELRALAHPKLSQPLHAALLTESGDATWRAGDDAAAREKFERAQALVQPEPQERALAARLWALEDRRRWPALRRLLAEADNGPETVLALRDLAAAEPREGLPPYLLAKQMQNRAAWEECARFAREALARSLPSALFQQEALRMLGMASWHLGDTAAARDAFTRLGAAAPRGRANESARWLQLLDDSG